MTDALQNDPGWINGPPDDNNEPVTCPRCDLETFSLVMRGIEYWGVCDNCDFEKLLFHPHDLS